MSLLNHPLTQHRILVPILVIVPIAYLASLPWLKGSPDWLIFTLGGIAVLVEVGGSFILFAQNDQQSDEWHRGATRFGTQWGWLVGAGIIPLLLVLPPFQNLVLSLATLTDQDANLTERAALMTFLMGFGAVVVLQAIFTAVFSLVWRIWMSRAV